MDQPWLALAIGLGLGLLIAGLVGLALACRRLSARLQEIDARHKARVDELRRDIAGYQQGSIRMGEELLALREQVRRLEDKQQRIEQHDPQSMPYNQAARLVGMGASLEDLTQSCGLSKAEAELVMKMYAGRKS